MKLPVKGGAPIQNNFELIITNSIYRPEEVFKYLGKKNAKQILRRIFNSHLKSAVYQLTANQQQLAEALSDNFSMNSLEFEK